MSPWLWLPAIGTLALVLLPVWGLWLTYHEPAGLFEAPPLSFERVWPLLFRSLSLSVIVGCLALVLGSWFAWAEVRLTYPGRRWMAVLSLMPLACPSYLVATVTREQMAPSSFLGGLFGQTDSFTGFWPAVLVLTVTCTPYVHLLAAAALRRCPMAEEDAARSLGASYGRIFKSIIAPRLRPTWAFGLVLVLLYVVSDFGAVAVLDCRVLTWELYQVKDGREAIVLGAGLMFVVLPLLLAVRLLHGSTQVERSVSQSAPQRRPLQGAGLMMTFILHTLVIGVGVLLPVLSLLHWVYQGWDHGVEFAPVLGPALTTVTIALTGAVLVLIVSSVVSWIAAQRRGLPATLVENGVYLTSAIPGVLVAVGILKLIIGLKREHTSPVWETLEGLGVFLLIGFTMRFLSQAYAALKPAFMRVDQSHLESARVLGASKWRRLTTIILPTAKPSLIAGYVLVFLSIAKELPITLMLVPLGYTTLAYQVYAGQDQAALPDVGLSGLALLLIAFMLQIFLNRWRRHV